MALIIDNLKITETNYSHTGSKWNGLTVYDKTSGKLIARVKTTAMYGSLDYMRDHPKSKYTKELSDKLHRASVEEWKIWAILA